VINVSWHDAMAFCRWLTGHLNLDGEVVRLPTEWEWQWVAQAGAAGLRFPWGPDWRDLGETLRNPA
jgi:formylglycine-generating enzyme required for sulfatase activity